MKRRSLLSRKPIVSDGKCSHPTLQFYGSAADTHSTLQPMIPVFELVRVGMAGVDGRSRSGWVRWQHVVMGMTVRRDHGRPQKIFQRGQNHQYFKKYNEIHHFPARQRRKRNILRFLRRFRLKCRVGLSMSSAEGTSDNFRVFCGTTAYDVVSGE